MFGEEGLGAGPHFGGEDVAGAFLDEVGEVGLGARTLVGGGNPLDALAGLIVGLKPMASLRLVGGGVMRRRMAARMS